MSGLILLAGKSFVIAGGALLLLKLMQNRSAADRSWVAHLALAILLIVPVASFAMPALDVVGPELLVGRTEVQSTTRLLPPAVGQRVRVSVAATPPRGPVADQPERASASIDWLFWGYIAPTAALLLLTLIAMTRLAFLRARATVLVDAPWLTALARAQKRMGFKHGTALLTSDELPSPISWGVIRPVILLNSEAVESHNEAEAIITHELAHVARLDWAKLLLARAAVALFWFNPFVWLLAREAHQLREEAADDAVLATDIDGAEYASLLVGVARHECRGILVGAHGVASGRNSLTRRVKRILDSAARRASGGWRWRSAAAFFAAGLAVSTAALNLVPAAATSPNRLIDSGPVARRSSASGPLAAHASTGAPLAASDSTDLDGITMGTSPRAGEPGETGLHPLNASSNIMNDGQGVLRSSDGSTMATVAPKASARGSTILQNSNGSMLALANTNVVLRLTVATSSSSQAPTSADAAMERAIAMKTVGITPEYAAAIRAAAPQLRISDDDMVELKRAGVTAGFIQELARLGYRNVSADDIARACVVGLREDYIHALASAGYDRLPLHELNQLKSAGITPADVERFRQAGYDHIDPEKLLQLKKLGITPEDIRASERNGP